MQGTFTKTNSTSAVSGRAIVWILIALVLVLGGASSWYYFVFMPGKKSSEKLTGIAKLVHFMNSVESRQAGKIDWRAAQKQQELFDGDAIKTAVEANALIRYNENDTIRLDENSLVVIHALQRGADGMEANLEVLSGSVFGLATTTKLRITSGNSVTVLTPSGVAEKPASLLIQVGADKSARISVVEGAAETHFTNNADKILLASGQGVNLSADGAGAVPSTSTLPAAPQLLSPTDKTNFPLNNSQTSVAIEFTIAKAAESVGWRYHLQVATDRNFSSVVANKYFDGDSVSVGNLPAGDYFWSVAAVDANQLHGSFAPTQSFAIGGVASNDGAPTATPTPVAEPHHFDVQKIESTAQLWRAGEPAKQLQVGMQVGSGDSIEVATNGTVYLADGGDKTVVLQLRANSKLAVNSATQTSKEAGVTQGMLDATLLRGAVVVHQDQQTAAKLTQQIKVGEASFVFGKQQLGEAAQSDVLIEQIPPDRYRLVVLRGGYEAKTTGEQAGAAPILGNKGLSVRNAENAAIHYDGELPIVLLQWPASQGPYTVEISRDRDFKKILRRETVKENNLPLLLDGPGTYYWRWRNAAGKLGAASPTSLTLSDKPPVVVKNVSAAATHINDKQQLAVVPYFDQPPQLTWSWARTANAVAYQLEISINPTMQTPFFQSEKVRQNSLSVVIDALKPGDYFWRVKQFDFRGKLVATTANHTIRVRSEAQPLGLQVSNPTTNLQVKDAIFVTSGKVTGKGVATLNGEKIQVAANGSFKHQLTLQPGENVLVFRLQGSAGTIITIQNKKVFYVP